MAQERSITPEKQLLKLIEDPKINAASVNARAIKHQSLSLFSFSAWLGRISFFKEELKKFPAYAVNTSTYNILIKRLDFLHEWD